MVTESSQPVDSLSIDPPPVRRRRHRIWIPVTIVVVALLAGLTAWQVPSDNLDTGARRLAMFVIAVIATICLNAWWVFGSGVSRTTRWSVESGLVFALIAAVLSVARIEFTGDMKPIPHFRWEASQDATLEAHRAKHAALPAGPQDAKSVTWGWQEAAEYRGRKRDGVVMGPPLSRDWTTDPPALIWRQPVGGGYSAFSLADGRAVTIEQRRQQEAVVAYAAATGQEQWRYEYPALFSETLGGDGPRATPTIADDRVYALGATGELSCLELATGARIWSVNILERNRSKNIAWGMSGSPLAVDNLVVVNSGAQQGSADSRGLLALNRENGEIVWRDGKASASYSSPMLASLSETRQILIFDAGGLAGHDVAKGTELWRVPWSTQFDINVAQPLVFDGRQALITSASGAALYTVEKPGDVWLPFEEWRNRSLKCNFTNPVARQGYVYGLDEGILVCLEVATGKRQWKQGRYGHGQLLLSGDLLVILSEQGELALVEAVPDKYHELARMQAIEGKTWNCPTLVNGRIYIRNHLEMACYDLRPKVDRTPAPPGNAPHP